MIVGVDLDSTVYPFIQNYMEFIRAEELFDVPEGYVPDRWSFYEDLGMTFQDFTASLERGASEGKIFKGDGFNDMPYAGFSHVVRNLRSEGHHIHIITHRNVKHAVGLTMEWLDSYGISFGTHFDAIHFVQDKTLVNVDILIDDSQANYYAATKLGQCCAIYTQPWNAHVNSEFRVNDWADVDQLVRSLSV